MTLTRVTFLLVGLLALVAFGGVAYATRGGPDGGGYTFIDNKDPAGPIFQFQDIGNGIDIGQSCDDCVVPLGIGFPFTFYGSSYTSMNVSSNGNIQFDTSSTSFSNASLPVSGLGRTIAAFWDDLQTNCTSVDAIYTIMIGQAPNRIRVVQWRLTPHFSCPTNQGDVITFQALLFEGSNDILFVYPDTIFATSGGPSANNSGASATVGVQRDSAVGLQYSFNSAVVTNGLAICYMPPQGAFRTSVCGRASGPNANPNVSGALGAIVAGADGTRDNLARQAQAAAAAQQAAGAAAAAAAAAQPSGVLRPPSTGDAGLIAQDSDGDLTFVILAGVLGLSLLGGAGVMRLRLSRQR